jgi:hypothetical protein
MSHIIHFGSTGLIGKLAGVSKQAADYEVAILELPREKIVQKYFLGDFYATELFAPEFGVKNGG